MSSPVGDDNVTNSNGVAARGWKGKVNAKDAVVCDSIMTVKGDEAENEGKEDEDEYVIRTDHLVRNDKRS